MSHIRSTTYKSILKQRMSFFDMPENGTGILCTRLATEAENIKGISAQMAGGILHGISSLLAGAIIGFIFGWKLALVILACVPLIGFARYAELLSHSGYNRKTKAAFETATQLASEAIKQISTVSSMGREETFIQLYHHNLVQSQNLAVRYNLFANSFIRGALVASIGFACSNALVYLFYALSFYYGSYLILNDGYTVERVFQVVFSVLLAAFEIAQVVSYTPKASKAKVAMESFFKLVDGVADSNSGKGANGDIKGDINAKKISFSYPLRTNTKALDNFTAHIHEGQNIAIVGKSGSGKSTILSLLLKFYDVDSGELLVEGINIKDWSFKELRSNMALVDQEPVLFNRSIRDNIAYGLNGASEEMIEQAAKLVSIHEFIMSLPDGYNTNVGECGSQLSGGQKQRIAIARAIIRRPKLLLLDEATSALDAETERAIQATLNSMKKGINLMQ